MSRYSRELSLAAAYAVMLLLLATFAPRFFLLDNLRSLLVSAAPVLVAVVGMTLVILSRQIDISIGSQMAVCGIVAGIAARAGLPMPLVVLLTLSAGAALGAINGSLVAGLGLPSIVVTLATMAILREGLRWWRQGEFVKDLPPSFQWFGLGQDAGQWLVVSMALFVFVVFAWSLQNLAAGRAIYATGSDPEAAFLAGLAPRRVVFGVFVTMGALSSMAALLNAVRFVAVDPNIGTGEELKVIAAVVVGGVAITGGRGTLVGPLLGVALLESIRPALQFLRSEPQWEKAIQGAIILVAVSADAFQFRRRKHAAASHAGR